LAFHGAMAARRQIVSLTAEKANCPVAAAAVPGLVVALSDATVQRQIAAPWNGGDHSHSAAAAPMRCDADADAAAAAAAAKPSIIITQ